MMLLTVVQWNLNCAACLELVSLAVSVQFFLKDEGPLFTVPPVHLSEEQMMALLQKPLYRVVSLASEQDLQNSIHDSGLEVIV